MKFEFVCMVEDSIINLVFYLDCCLYCRDMIIGCIDFVVKFMFEVIVVFFLYFYDEVFVNFILN